nr:hypothetical protein [Tanacetum cinerariifolium]
RALLAPRAAAARCPRATDAALRAIWGVLAGVLPQRGGAAALPRRFQPLPDSALPP